MTETKVCPGCEQVKPYKAFHKNKARTDGLQGYCKDCKREKDRAYYYRHHHKERIRHNRKSFRRRREIKRRYLALLQELACVDCGESEPACLDFDHVRGEKFMPVSTLTGRGYRWETIEAEIAKCEVRCANCHRKKTAREHGWYASG